jgi:protein transport protein SEC31
MPLAGGAVAANERFHRLAWGPHMTESTPYGLIAGGLVDGSVNLYNPARIIGSPVGSEPSDGAGGALLTKMQKHSGPVRGLEWNSFSPNLLASGAEDGELCIWDLAKPTTPSLYPPLKGGAGQPDAGEVSYLAWNNKVQHILASSSLNGTTVVWDLKRQRPVISFTDPNSRRRCSAMQWNPEVATQLIVASDDDRSCSLQIWDLRNSISPAREFVGHSKGVLAMAWSKADPGLLLTCGKDNRTLCWDTDAGEILAELPASSNWNFDVQWSTTTPGVLSTSSFDGRVGLYNLQQASAPSIGSGAVDQYGVAQPAPKQPMKRAPAWMRRPCGATFGFGGQLAGFGVRVAAPAVGEGEEAAADKPSGTAVSVMRVATTETAAVSFEFEGAVSAGNNESLKGFCDAKRDETMGGEDEETWGFLGILFEDDARRELLKHLDFGEALIAKEAAAVAAVAAATAKADAENAAEAEAAAAAAADAAAAAAPLPPVDGNAFFENLAPAAAAPASPPPPPPVDDGMGFFDDLDANGGVPKPPSAPSAPPPPAPIAEAPEAVAARRAAEFRAAAAAAAALEPAEIMDASDALVQRALVVGDYRGAVDACVAAGRHADALVLASVGGAELWEETRAAHIAANARKPYMRVAKAVVSDDLGALVSSRSLAKWRETLAILCTYAPAEEWGSLAGVLAGRLAAAGDAHAATLCNVCAGDVDAAVGHWLGALPPGKVAPSALHSVLEKAVVLTRATGQTTSAGLSQLAVSYAETLASQGRMDDALSYLDMVPDGGEAVTTLRDRIVRGGAGKLASSSGAQSAYQAPPAPAAYNSAPAPAPAPYHPPVANGLGQNGYAGYAAQQPVPAVPSPSYGNDQGGYGAYGNGGGQSASAYGQSGYDSYGRGAAQNGPSSYGGTPSLPPAPAQSSYDPYAGSPAQSAYAASTPPQGMYSPQQGMMMPGPPSAAAPPATTVAAAPAFDPSASTPPPAPPSAPAPAMPPAYGGYQGSDQGYQAVMPPAQYGGAPAQMGAYGGAPVQQMQQAGYGAPQGSPMQPMQPQSQSVYAPPAAPVPPPAPVVPKPPVNLTMASVDTSFVSAAHKPIVASLAALFETCELAAGAHPARRREVEDSSKRLAVLLWKLNRQDVSSSALGKLAHMCAALDANDVASAVNAQIALTTSDWDEGSGWLTALKRLLKMRGSLG